jgi:hypothetical protein
MNKIWSYFKISTVRFVFDLNPFNWKFKCEQYLGPTMLCPGNIFFGSVHILMFEIIVIIDDERW